ncbi:MAG: FYVE zinc finger domain-containing protein [Pseudomonadota bacterium]
MEFSLNVPSEGQGATYYATKPSDPFDRFTIPGLTGCMGLICVVDDRNTTTGGYDALLVHDADSAYPTARRLFRDFVEAPGNASRRGLMHIVWRFAEEVGQPAWLRQSYPEIPGDNKRFELHNTVITWPATAAHTIPDRNGGAFEPHAVGRSLQLAHPDKKTWSDDKYCKSCRKDFSFFSRRRHHCRSCGSAVCDDCSAVVFPQGGPLAPGKPDEVKNRACVACLKALKSWFTE